MKFYQDVDSKEIVTKKESNHKYIDVEPNITEGAIEKHIPVYEKVGDKINVQVGSVNHPMLDNHYIEWIMLVNGNEITKINLKPGDDPSAAFDYIKGSTIYAYCNLHGLWKKDVF